MSMSTHVVGIKPPDETWHRMYAVWKACSEANISLPREVLEFFDDEAESESGPEPAGVIVDLEEYLCVSRWTRDMSEGYEIDVTALPKDVKVVRVFNSW